MQLRYVIGMALCLLTTTTTTALIAGNGPDRDPTGERAHYTVDRASSRTSSIVRSGNMEANVTMFLPDHPDGPAYDVQLDYEFVLQFLGTRSGTENLAVPETYFTPAFLAELRRTGQYNSPQFKITHKGYADARNMDGATYANCDKLEIYDIDQGSAAGTVARQLLATDAGVPERAEIEDLVILAHVKEGYPVLGAVKLDVSGVYEGIRVKAGADYEAP